MANKQEVFQAICKERDYQDEKWGPVPEHAHDIPSWLLIMRKKIEDAENAWMKISEEEAMRHLLQTTAVGFAAMEQLGISERE